MKTKTTLPAPHPPLAKKVPHQIETHGDVRVDDYFWMRDKENPEVIAHLNAENAYTDAVMKPLEGFRETLFEEMKARVKEDDSEVPKIFDGWIYYSRVEAGQQYGIHCRKKIVDLAQTKLTLSSSSPEEILLDENALAVDHEHFSLGVFEVSPDHRWLAYAVDIDGSEHHTIYFKNLETGELSPDSIPDASSSLEWANDNRTVFYTMLDANDRPDRVFKHRVGTDIASDVLVYKEQDPQLFVSCSKTRSRKFIFIELNGTVTSEIHAIDADRPMNPPMLIEPRKSGVEYEVDHHGERFLIVTNDIVQNFRLVEAPINAPGKENWKELRRGSDDLLLQAVDLFESYMIIYERFRGLPQVRVVELTSQQTDLGTGLSADGFGEEYTIDFPEPTYTVGASWNPMFNSTTYRMVYASMVTPSTVFDYDFISKTRLVRKVQEIPSGYDSTLYRSERLFAKAADGVEIPISLVYRLDADGGFKKNGSRPLYLYGYGSYGITMPASFGTARLSLIDRGFVYAIAHVRGGAEVGRQWYENAKFLKKKTTFSDFISVAEYLIQSGYTSEGQIVASGGSAGGLLVGAVCNMRPELFKAIVADVPFVDVVSTMLDDTLPLTALEYDEWGNPNDKVYYDYIKSYSPYDNVKPQLYPHMFVTSGLNDPRVTYWEPAKWVAKLREVKQDDNLVLQHINMTAGHGGASGRYEGLKEAALEYAFVLNTFGLAKRDPEHV